MPKPHERFVFLILALTIPVGAFLIALTVFRRQDKRNNRLNPPILPSLKKKISGWLGICRVAPYPALRASFTVKGARANLLWCSTFLTQNMTGVLIFATTAILYFPFIGYDFSQALLTGVRLPSEHPILILMMTFLVAATWYVWPFSCVGCSSIIKPGRVGVAVS